MRPTLIEIEAKVKEIWDDAETIHVDEHGPLVRITVEAMYESPGRSLPQLIQLSEFLGTKEIEDVDQYGYGGCESCDYGSRYGFTLEARLP